MKAMLTDDEGGGAGYETRPLRDWWLPPMASTGSVHDGEAGPSLSWSGD
jgi:hypothetical protein